MVRSCFEADSVMEFGFVPVCDQLRTSFEPTSVMEFGFNKFFRAEFGRQYRLPSEFLIEAFIRLSFEQSSSGIRLNG